MKSLAYIIFFHLISTAAGDKNSLPKNDNRKMCHPGQAIQDLKFLEKGGPHLEVTIQCVNVTSACEEKCEWHESCMVERYGTDSYVRGVDPYYDNLRDAHQTGFLCCKAKFDNTTRRCHKGEFKNTNDITDKAPMGYVRQSKQEGDHVMIEKCDLVKSVTNACGMKTTKSDINVNYGLSGLAGLAGLAGIALIKKRTCANAPGTCCVDVSCETVCQTCQGTYTSFCSECGADCCCDPDPGCL